MESQVYCVHSYRNMGACLSCEMTMKTFTKKLDPSGLWFRTPEKAKEGWLKHHGFNTDYKSRNWDSLPEYVREKWEDESES